MELYNETSRAMSRELTKRYSTSFGWATKLVDIDIRDDVYAIYGLVRVADEIVDTYEGPGAQELLDALEDETYAAIERRYSTNPVVHAFQLTANAYGITKALIRPFFASMRVDIAPPKHFSQRAYETYIYGSAEVVGLMCLKVFVGGDQKHYHVLKAGASRLGSAYQKVNFLRDFAADSQHLGRVYFPNVTTKWLDEAEKATIIADIQTDFLAAKPYISALPSNARTAVGVSFTYYSALLEALARTPASTICTQRVRISNMRKIWLLIKTVPYYAVRPRSKAFAS